MCLVPFGEEPIPEATIQGGMDTGVIAEVWRQGEGKAGGQFVTIGHQPRRQHPEMGWHIDNRPSAIPAAREFSHILKFCGEPVEEEDGKPVEGLLQLKGEQHQLSLCLQKVTLGRIQPCTNRKGEVPGSPGSGGEGKELGNMNLCEQAHVSIVDEGKTKASNIGCIGNVQK